MKSSYYTEKTLKSISEKIHLKSCMSEKTGVNLSVPRKASVQKHRNNPQSKTVEDNFR